MFRRLRWWLVAVGFEHWLWAGRVGIPIPKRWTR